MSNYKYLTFTDRLKIEMLYNRHVPKKEIARELNCCLKTIYNEIPLGLYDHLERHFYKTERFYSAEIAQNKHDWRVSAKGRPLALGHNYDFTNNVREYIIVHHFAPDVITHLLSNAGFFTVSTTTLYRYIDAGYIPGVSNSNLMSKRKRKYSYIPKVKRAPKGTSIELRSHDIDTREEFYHWEMDSIIGMTKGTKQSALTLVERKSQYIIIRKARDKSASETTRILKSLDCKYTFKTITVDNGSEFADNKGMEKKKDGSTRTKVYYCHPYSSYERGTNENMNRMIRRFVPKGKSLKNINQKQLTEIETWLNNYPRRILGYKTPQQVYDENIFKEKL